MMKKILLSFAASFAALICWAGEPVQMGAEDSQKALDEIVAASSSLKSLQTDFTQEVESSMLEEKAISAGKMYYQDGKLRWEYTSPNSFMIIYDGSNIIVRNDEGVQRISSSANRQYKGIADMIKGSLTGAALSNSSAFSVSMFTEDGNYLAKLIPLKRELKQMYSAIWMHFDKDMKVRQVDLMDSAGKTVIYLTNSQYDKDLDPEYFTAD